MKTPLALVVTGALLAFASLVVVPVGRAQAQANPALLTINVDGFQANDGSPFVLKGDLIGDGAVWRHLAGPVLSSPLATIPPSAAASFAGATCEMEYLQGEIVTQDGSTLTGVVYGVRCEPNPPTGAYIPTGTYSIQGGTGQFQGFIGTGHLL